MQNAQTTTPPDKFAPLLTVKEACDYLKVSRAWFYDHRGEFECIRMGGHSLRVRTESVEAYLDRNKVGA